MNRREFAKSAVLLGVGGGIRPAMGTENAESPAIGFYEEPAQKIPDPASSTW